MLNHWTLRPAWHPTTHCRITLTTCPTRLHPQRVILKAIYRAEAPPRTWGCVIGIQHLSSGLYVEHPYSRLKQNTIPVGNCPLLDSLCHRSYDCVLRRWEILRSVSHRCYRHPVRRVPLPQCFEIILRISRRQFQ